MLAVLFVTRATIAQTLSSDQITKNEISRRLNSLTSTIDTQTNVLNDNAESLRRFNSVGTAKTAESFVLHSSPATGSAAVIDNLLMEQHLDLWQRTANTLQSTSTMLKNLSSKVSSMSAKEAIVEISSNEAPETLRQLFSVTPNGQSLPAPPHIQLQPSYRPSIGDFILGRGSDAATIDYPAVAEINYIDNGGHFSTQCTGTLIAADAVLTAAHCFCDFVGAKDAQSCKTQVYQYGLNKSATATEKKYFSMLFQSAGLIGIKDILIDPQYKNTTADLAIIKLATAVTSIHPAPINGTNSIAEGIYGFIVGFGVRSAPIAGGDKQQLSIVAKGGSEGLKLWARVQLGKCPPSDPVTDHICWLYARSQGDQTIGSTCHGDSGGPLFIQFGNGWYLAGTTSGGRDDCSPSENPSDVSYDIDLSKNLDWIKSVVPTVVTRGAKDTLFLVDQSDRAVGVPYRIFTEDQDQWSTTFDLPSSVKSIKVTVNTTPTLSHLKIELIPPPAPNSRNCTKQSEDAYVSCSVDSPVQGTWRALVSGSKPQESQLLGTAGQ